MNDDREYQFVLDCLGKKIRERRKILRMKLRELSFITDIHITYLSSLERGHRNVAAINIYKIAKALKIPLTDIFPKI